jgi:hypothetical protein
VTNNGDCNWKPQPICSPPARSASSTAARQSMELITPAANTKPLVRTAAGCFLACSTRPMALIDSTGNTQGMRFKIRPPRIANSSSTGSDVSPVVAAAPLCGAPEAGSPPEKTAAISRGTVTVSLPLCSVASKTPRMCPALGGRSPSFIDSSTESLLRVRVWGAAYSMPPSS